MSAVSVGKNVTPCNDYNLGLLKLFLQQLKLSGHLSSSRHITDVNVNLAQKYRLKKVT